MASSVLVIGAGANLQDVRRRMLEQFVEKTGIPFLTSHKWAKGVIDERHPNSSAVRHLSAGDFVHAVEDAGASSMWLATMSKNRLSS
jgi:thiamine pyrophosphate-dependent acetolactate synthase large subunit-like protein